MKIFKSIIIILLLASAVAILIFGPRQEPKLADDRKNDVVIQYWEKWTGTEESQMRQIVDDFNNTVGKEKHITVQYLSMTNIDQKCLVATAGGVPPDVAGLWQAQLIQYSELNAFEPLEDLAAAHGITKGYYKPAYWDACHWNGHLYCLISTPAAVALHYNKKTFQENADKLRAAGLDPNRPPQTIEELDRYASVLDTFETFNGAKHLDRAGYLPMEPGWYIQQTAYWFGGQLWNPDTEKFTLTDPNVVKAYEWIQGYSKRLGKDVLSEFSSGNGGFNSPQNPFLCDKVVMEQQGPWMANYIHTLAPQMDNDWAAAPFPASAESGLKDVTFVDFDLLAIPRGSKHKPEAFEFIAFVNRQEEMEKLCMLHCKNSPLAKVSQNFLDHNPNPYIRVFEELAASPNAHGAMRCVIAPEVGAELNNMTQQIVLLDIDPDTGKPITPAAALAKTQIILQQKYDHYKESERIAAAQARAKNEQ